MVVWNKKTILSSFDDPLVNASISAMVFNVVWFSCGLPINPCGFRIVFCCCCCPNVPQCPSMFRVLHVVCAGSICRRHGLRFYCVRTMLAMNSCAGDAAVFFCFFFCMPIDSIVFVHYNSIFCVIRQCSLISCGLPTGKKQLSICVVMFIRYRCAMKSLTYFSCWRIFLRLFNAND